MSPDPSEVWRSTNAHLDAGDKAEQKGSMEEAEGEFKKAVEVALTAPYPYCSIACKPAVRYADFLYAHKANIPGTIDGIESLLKYVYLNVGRSYLALPEVGMSRNDFVNYGVICCGSLIIIKLEHGRYNDIRNLSQSAIRIGIDLLEQESDRVDAARNVRLLVEALVIKLDMGFVDYVNHKINMQEMKDRLSDLVPVYPVLDVAVEVIGEYINRHYQI